MGGAGGAMLARSSTLARTKKYAPTNAAAATADNLIARQRCVPRYAASV
jgi:hypothetical protein